MKLKHLFCAFVLLFAGCIEEYSDSIALNADGSAVFEASIYPCEADTNLIGNIKRNYDSVAGVKLDSVWFSQRDSQLSAVNFRISFENLLEWKGGVFDKDFIGALSLKKNDSPKNNFSFRRVLNPNAEGEDGEVIPEESVDSFAVEQFTGSDSAFWEYSLILPKGAVLLRSEPIDTASVSTENGAVLIRWKIPVAAAASKKQVLSADFEIPSGVGVTGSAHWSSLAAIGASCLVMLLAIAALIKRLGKLGTTLKTLKEKDTAARTR